MKRWRRGARTSNLRQHGEELLVGLFAGPGAEEGRHAGVFVLRHEVGYLARGDALDQRIDARLALRAVRQRSLACLVSRGEAWDLARRNGWGEEKQAALRNLLDNVVTVDINLPRVIEAHVELDLVSQAHPDGARNMGKNDLWSAAAARAASATRFTTDNDFDHLIPDYLAGVVIDPKVAATKDK